MTGPYDSVLGRDTDEVINMFYNETKTSYTGFQNEGMLCGVVLTLTGQQKSGLNHRENSNNAKY